MDLTVLKDQIMKNKLENFYVFTGTEIGVQDIYLKQMSIVLKKPLVRADSVLSVYPNFMSNSILGSNNCLYVVRNDLDFMKQENFYINIRNELGRNVLAVLYDKIDSRLKFGKTFNTVTVNFEKLSTNVIVSYVKKEGLSNEIATELSNKLSNSYDLIMSEVEKIKIFAKMKNISVDESARLLIDSGMVVSLPDVNVFMFVEAMLKHDGKQAMQILRYLDSNSVNVLGVLYNSFKTVLLIQCCESPNICETTGLDNKSVYFNKKYINIYSTEKLVNIIKMLAQTVENIKNGRIDDTVSIKYAVTQIL